MTIEGIDITSFPFISVIEWTDHFRFSSMALHLEYCMGILHLGIVFGDLIHVCASFYVTGPMVARIITQAFITFCVCNHLWFLWSMAIADMPLATFSFSFVIVWTNQIRFCSINGIWRLDSRLCSLAYHLSSGNWSHDICHSFVPSLSSLSLVERIFIRLVQSLQLEICRMSLPSYMSLVQWKMLPIFFVVFIRTDYDFSSQLQFGGMTFAFDSFFPVIRW